MKRPLRLGLLFLLSAVLGCAGAREAVPGGPSPQAAVDRPRTGGIEGPRPVGRAAVERLRVPDLELDPPEASEHEVVGVPVYHLHDPSLPLVDLFVQMEGGVVHFPRRELGPISGFSTFLRNGGTTELPPDSVSRRLDLLALQLGFGSGGSGSYASLNSLRSTLDEGLELFQAILTRPGFDPEAVEVWRGQELDRVRRRADNPSGLAYDEFNRLMFGDHPVGWVTEEADLAEEHFTSERLQSLRERLLCRERLIVGIAGDLTWEEAEPRIRTFLEAWPECGEELPEPASPDLRTEGGVFVLPRELDQTTVVMAHTGGLRQEDSPDYFASRVANLILGGGGFTSRLMARVRTEEGMAYGASSLWTTPVRYEGLVGAVTATRSDRTVEAVRLLLEILDDFRSRPPAPSEVDRAVEQIANGYVFAFQSSRQVVSRRMGDLAHGLPEDWLERYLAGIQGVGPNDVHRVSSRYIDPERMTILLVGDAEAFGPGLEEIGPVYRLSTDGTVAPWDP